MSPVKPPSNDSRYRIARYHKTRNFALTDGATGQLLAVIVYKRGAMAIRAELERRDGAQPKPAMSPVERPAFVPDGSAGSAEPAGAIVPRPATATNAANLHKAALYLTTYAGKIQTTAPELASQIRATAAAIQPRS